MEFKKLLTAVHAVNVDQLPKYNLVVIYDEGMKFVLKKVMQEKMHCVQHAFWFDTSEKKPKGM